MESNFAGYGPGDTKKADIYDTFNLIRKEKSTEVWSNLKHVEKMGSTSGIQELDNLHADGEDIIEID